MQNALLVLYVAIRFPVLGRAGDGPFDEEVALWAAA